MLTYVVKRLLWLPFLLIAVTLITFTLGFYGPGDPAEVRLGAKATPESVERLRTQMGLDRPFVTQYTDYVWSALQGDFGESYSLADRQVTEIIGRKVWISAQLGMAALALAVIIGIPLGLLAAYHQGTWMDTALISFALLFYATPVFISAPFLILLLSLWLNLLPTAGWGGLLSTQIIMPTLVMGLPGVAGLSRLTRASALEVLGEDYVRTARSKGLSESVIQSRHVLRNALIPITTVLGLSLATLVEGAFITETIFGIPGIGRFAVDSIFNRDYPVVMALVIIVAVTFVLANLLVDIFYALLDPRIRYK
jgi:ABC-type dipeptide/oligopeptide/nickel transport system permease component